MQHVLDRTRGKLVLADGVRFDGYLTGRRLEMPVWGEVVFNTSMTGYQEVITDPSYAGQIVAMTYPQIGNYGVCPGDDERARCAARALVVRELSPFFSPSPGTISLETFMVERGLPGLTGVDTRALTRHIRSRGAVMAAIGSDAHTDEKLRALARSRSFSRDESLVESVSRFPIDAGDSPGAARAALIDLGIKQSIVERVRALGVTPVVFGASFDAGDVLDGGFEFAVVSNGPGDPGDVPRVVREVERLIGHLPVLGICLGHQITALALGGRTYKLKFGHHGANQPVVDARSGRVYITSQNHGYAVGEDIEQSTGVSITYTNASDGTVEGFANESLMVECVQFHPEASPGPNDTRFIFDEFYSRVKGWRDAKVA